MQAGFKIEFGRTPKGKILLADEVGTLIAVDSGTGLYEWEFLSIDNDVFRKNKGNLLQPTLLRQNTPSL